MQGFGLMLASFVLYWAGLSAGATVEQVSDETVRNLGMYYVPTVMFIWMLMMVAISAYKIDRVEHEDNIRRLADN